MIYLDNAATSWPKPETVYQAVDACLRQVPGNPGRGAYAAARNAAMIVNRARELAARLINAPDPSTVAFMANATEALNTALFGILNPGDLVIADPLAHNAVARPLRELVDAGVRLQVLPVDRSGGPSLAALAAALPAKPKAVVLTHASNVTGSLTDIAAAGKLAAAAGAVLIVDAAQTIGFAEIDVQAWHVDLLAFSGHKGLLGPQGTGGLFVRPGLSLRGRRFGGTGSLSESDRQPEFMPDRLESGTPNTPGLAGLAAGIEYIMNVGLSALAAREAALTEQILAGLEEVPGARIIGPGQGMPRAPVVSFVLDGLDCGAVAHLLDRDFGIACRAGLHCAPWAHISCGTLATGTVRVSPGCFNTAKDIETLIDALQQIARLSQGPGAVSRRKAHAP